MKPRITQHPFEFACDTRPAVAVLPDRPGYAEPSDAGGIIRLIVCVRNDEHRPPCAECLRQRPGAPWMYNRRGARKE